MIQGLLSRLEICEFLRPRPAVRKIRDSFFAKFIDSFNIIIFGVLQKAAFHDLKVLVVELDRS